MNPANFVTHHPYQATIYAILFTNFVATMPSPNGVGIRATTAYKWIFAFLHAIPNIPRLLITFFPSIAGSMKLLNPAETADKVASNSQGESK
jgi:hypothetical protein